MLEILFWVLIGLILYTYVGYLLLLLLISDAVQSGRDLRYLFNRRDRRSRAADPPRVSLLVSAFNEEKVIEERVRNALALDYPRDRLEIVIASDGSDDRTAEIVRQFEDQGVRLLDYQERQGKVSALNKSIPQCTGDIVVLSDANTIYEKDAVAHIVKHFADDRVGIVVGEMRLGSPDAAYKAEQRYWQYEVILKFLENRLGVAFGVGGIYAIRKSLFSPVPPNTVTEDFVIPMAIRAQGARMVYEPEALAFEETARDVSSEAVRRIRIAAGNYQSIWRAKALLNPFRGWIAFCFWSHKVASWLVPHWLIALLGVNAVLVVMAIARPATQLALPVGVYHGIMAGSVVFYALAALGCAIRRGGVLGKLLGIPRYFTVMNLSLFRGFLRCVLGRQAVAWKRTER